MLTENQQKALLTIARDAIKSVLDNYTFIPPKLESPLDTTRGVFVTLYTKDKELRGCIGHIAGICPTLAHEVAECAIAAAFEDPRFPTVTHKEFEALTLEISLLNEPEPIEGIQELDPKKYGVIVTMGMRRGLLLPDIDGVDSADQQIRIAKQKAGIFSDQNLSLQRFSVEKIKEDHHDKRSILAEDARH